MANQSKLKAWVRVDGTNTVVLAGPIFSRTKPKDGKWRELNVNLCCNGSTPSSTTTTTSSTTTQGINSWTVYQGYNTESACLHVYGATTGFTLPGQSFGDGVVLYSDTACTNPWINGFFALDNGSVYSTNMFGVIGLIGPCSVITTTSTTTTPVIFYNADYQFGGSGDPCVGSGQWNLPLEFPSGFCTSASVNLASGYTWAQYGINAGATLKVKDPNSNQYARVNVQSGSAGYNFGCNNC